MGYRLRMQITEALGPVNRWYCSQAYCRRVDDEDLLLTYFIKSGGAKDFADRYEKAMGALNRWYCSQFYNREIRDPEILWNYFCEYGQGSCLSTRQSQHERAAELLEVG